MPVYSYCDNKLVCSGQKITHEIPRAVFQKPFCAWRFQFAIGNTKSKEGELEIRSCETIIPVKNTDDLNEDDKVYWVTDLSMLEYRIQLKFTFKEEGYQICFLYLYCRPYKLPPITYEYDLFTLYFRPGARFEYQIKGCLFVQITVNSVDSGNEWKVAEQNELPFNFPEDTVLELRQVQYGFISASTELTAPWKDDQFDFEINNDDFYIKNKITSANHAQYVTHIFLHQKDLTIELAEGFIPADVNRNDPFEVTAVHSLNNVHITQSYGTHQLPFSNPTFDNHNWKKLFNDQFSVELETDKDNIVEQNKDYHKLMLNAEGRFVFWQGVDQNRKMQGTFSITQVLSESQFDLKLESSYCDLPIVFHLDQNNLLYSLHTVATEAFDWKPIEDRRVSPLHTRTFAYSEKPGLAMSLEIGDLLHPRYCQWLFVYYSRIEIEIRRDKSTYEQPAGEIVTVRNANGEEVNVYNQWDQEENTPVIWITDRSLLTTKMFCAFTYPPKEEREIQRELYVICKPYKIQPPTPEVDSATSYKFSADVLQFRWKGSEEWQTIKKGPRKNYSDPVKFKHEDDILQVRSKEPYQLYSEISELEIPWKSITIDLDDLILKRKVTTSVPIEVSKRIFKQRNMCFDSEDNKVPETILCGVPFEVILVVKVNGSRFELSCGFHCIPVPFLNTTNWKSLQEKNVVHICSFDAHTADWNWNFYYNAAEYHRLTLSPSGCFAFRAQWASYLQRAPSSCTSGVVVRGTFDVVRLWEEEDSGDSLALTVELKPLPGNQKLKFRVFDPQLSTADPLRNLDLLKLILTWISVDQKRNARTVCKLWAQAISLFPAKFSLYCLKPHDNAIYISEDMFDLVEYVFGVGRSYRRLTLEESDDEQESDDEEESDDEQESQVDEKPEEANCTKSEAEEEMEDVSEEPPSKRIQEH